MKDLISVIVPVYNVELYISECVNSILNQTYKNLEVILVDDGSKDNSSKICDEFKIRDKRVIVIHKNNGGLSSARNAGLDIMKGKFVAFVDSDDYISADYISLLHKRIIEDDSEIAICNYLKVNEVGDKMSHISEVSDQTLSTDAFWDFFCNNTGFCVSSCNKLYVRKLWDKIRFLEGKQNEDLFVIPYLVRQCNRISTLSSCLYYYRQRTGSIMHSFSIKNLDNVEGCLRLGDYFLSESKYKCAVHMLDRCTCLLIDVYNKLDLNDRENNAMYLSVRKEYKQFYKKVSQHPEISKRFLKSTIYMISDRLFKFTF